MNRNQEFSRPGREAPNYASQRTRMKPRAAERRRYVHAPRRVSPVSVRRTCPETPVPIDFQVYGLVWMPSIFVAPRRVALMASVSAAASVSPTARWRVPARDGRGKRDGGSYLCEPSAFSVSCTAGRAPTLAMKALMFGHLPRSILCMPVQLRTVYR